MWGGGNVSPVDIKGTSVFIKNNFYINLNLFECRIFKAC